jgi:hypothetical protein
MDVEDLLSSLPAMLLGNDPAGGGAYNPAEGDDAWDARVVVCESFDMLTM